MQEFSVKRSFRVGVENDFNAFVRAYTNEHFQGLNWFNKKIKTHTKSLRWKYSVTKCSTDRAIHQNLYGCKEIFINAFLRAFNRLPVPGSAKKGQ